MPWGYWLIAAVALGVLVAAVLWWRSAEPPPPLPPPPPPPPGQHTYGHCPGCWAYVVQALCEDRVFRIFDAEPIAVLDEDPEPDTVEGEPTTLTLERRQRAARRARDLNDQLWVFDPTGSPAMRRYVRPGQRGEEPPDTRRQRHVRQGHGLTRHYCALGLPARPDEPQWGEPVRWRTNGMH